MFKNRDEAALRLAEKLQFLKGKKALVLAIPRGGVPLGKIISDAIDGELDVVLVHKLGHPNHPEYAIGAIDEEGSLYLDEDALEPTLRAHLLPIERKELKRLKSLREQYTPLKNRIDPRGRLVVVVDDGLATGWTIKAAIAWLCRKNAKEIVIAIPVGPPESVKELRSDPRVKAVICLLTPRNFSAVGEFYEDFRQIEDDEVRAMLAENTRRPKM